MGVNREAYIAIKEELDGAAVTLVAVSKIKTVADIKELYDAGQRDFGENYVQELVEKQPQLPADIHWHFIGHLQSNKVKYLAPFIYMIQGVDSLKLLREINKQGEKNNRTIKCLLQIHIAQEETKFGMDADELALAMSATNDLKNVQVCGLMGMASFSEDNEVVRSEFQTLKRLAEKYTDQFAGAPHRPIISMGMSGDYKLAMEEGSNMVRIGSLLFGRRS